MGRSSRKKISLPQADALGRVLPRQGDLRIHLDDDVNDRQAPEGWFHFTTTREVQDLLLSGRVSALSLDNDLGSEEEEGYRIIDFLEEQDAVFGLRLWPEQISVHTANPDARQRMRRSLETLPQRHSHLRVREDRSGSAAQPLFLLEEV